MESALISVPILDASRVIFDSLADVFRTTHAQKMEIVQTILSVSMESVLTLVQVSIVVLQRGARAVNVSSLTPARKPVPRVKYVD